MGGHLGVLSEVNDDLVWFITRHDNPGRSTLPSYLVPNSRH